MDMEKIGQAGRSTSNSIDMRRKRKEAEEALKASENSYRRLFESAQDGILLLDADTGQITDVNPYLIKMLGYSHNEFLGKKLWDIGLFKHIAENQAGFQKLQSEKYTRYENLSLETKGGRHIDVEFVSNVYLVDHKTVIQCNIRDITERREIENGLEKARKELEITKIAEDEAIEYAESIINTVRETLIALDKDLRVVKVNRSFYEVFKLKPEETVGQLIYDLGNKQWDIPKLRELLATILPQKATFDNYEVEHDFATIGRRTMLLNARQIQRGLGKERIILLAIEDITERKRIESIGRLATVVRDSNDAITIQDFGGKITAWNHGAELMFGYSEQEALKMTIWQLTPPDKAAEQKESTRRIFAGEKVPSFETQRLTRDGRLLDVWLTVTNLVDDTGKITGIAVTERDITDRKRKEKEFESAKSLLDTVIDLSPFAMWISDREGILIRTNRSLRETLNLTDEQLIGKYNVLNDVNLEMQGVMPMVRAVFEMYTPARFMIPWKASNAGDVDFKGGRDVYIDVSMFPILDNNGELTNVVCQWVDITERKEVEEALQESEKRYRQVVENAVEIIYSTDANGNFTWANFTALKAVGYTLEELQRFNYLDLVVPEHRDRLSKIYISQFREKQPTTYVEFPLLNKSGEVMWFGQNVLLVIEGGKVTGFHIIARDVTERKRAEEDLLRQRTLLDGVNKVLREAITSETEADLVRTCLAVAEELTGSKFGFINELNEAGSMDTIALSDPGWTACRMPQTNAVILLKNVPIRGIWANTIREGEPVIVNDLASHPNRVGIPEGHPPILRFLGVPLKRGGNTIGLIGLANKESDYDFDDQQNIEVLSFVFVEALMRKRAEEAIESLAKFPSENPSPILRVGRDGTLLYANEASHAILLDWQLDIGKPAPLVLREVASGTLTQQVRKIIDTEHNQQIISFFVAPVANAGYVNFYGRDVTDRRRAEEALRESEETARALVNATTDSIFLIDTHGIVLALNEMTAKRLGKRVDEMLGSYLYDFLPPDVAQRRKKCLDEVFHTGKPAYFEDERQGIWFDTCGYPILDAKGRVARLAIYGRDITERKRAEEALVRSEERFRLAAGSATDLIYEWDIKERVDWFGKIDELLGYARGEFPRTLEGWADSVHPDDRDRAMAAVKNHLEKNEPYDIEYRIREKDGTYRYWWARGTAVRDEKGNPYRWIGAITDITEHKRAEEEIRKLNAELEQRVRDRTAQLEVANKELEAFSYSVSHDLRAPLRAIDAFSRVILEDYTDKLDDEGKRYLNIIGSNTKKMGQLIDDLLVFSRLGRQELGTSGIDIGRLAKAVSEELKLTVPERKLKFTINTLIPAQGDQAMIRQVFVNLLSNAVKFTRPKENATVEVGGGREGNENIYYVKDNGVGFDMQYVDKLFGVFQRLHSSEEFEGTGVGLAIVQRIIHRHGGRVWAEGKVGEGATFYFTLPKGNERR